MDDERQPHIDDQRTGRHLGNEEDGQQGQYRNHRPNQQERPAPPTGGFMNVASMPDIQVCKGVVDFGQHQHATDDCGANPQHRAHHGGEIDIDRVEYDGRSNRPQPEGDGQSLGDRRLWAVFRRFLAHPSLLQPLTRA